MSMSLVAIKESNVCYFAGHRRMGMVLYTEIETSTKRMRCVCSLLQ